MKIWETIRFQYAKSSLPVSVCVSKETLSTRTGGTTTAYRKFIFRSGHAQNLKS